MLLKKDAYIMKNLSSIEALRGIAAFAVMLFHFSQEKYGAPAWWRETFINGQLGVHIFFVISGFVIPLQLTRRNYQTSMFFRFQLNRFIRIYPNYIIAAFAAALIWQIQYLFLGGTTPADLSLSNIIKNLTLTADLLDGNYYINVAWTLAIEFYYYLVLGLSFVYLFSANSLIRVLSNILFLSSYYLFQGASSWNFFQWAPYFAVGFYLFRIKLDLYRSESYLFFILALTLVFLDTGFLSSLRQFIAVASVAMIIYISPNIKNKFLLFFGTISYSLYLTHNIFGSKFFKLIEMSESWIKLPYFVSLVLAVSFSVFVAYCFYLFIETTSHRLSKKVWKTRKGHLNIE